MGEPSRQASGGHVTAVWIFLWRGFMTEYEKRVAEGMRNSIDWGKDDPITKEQFLEFQKCVVADFKTVYRRMTELAVLIAILAIGSAIGEVCLLRMK